MRAGKTLLGYFQSLPCFIQNKISEQFEGFIGNEDKRENASAGYRMNKKCKYSKKSNRVQYLHFSGGVSWNFILVEV